MSKQMHQSNNGKEPEDVTMGNTEQDANEVTVNLLTEKFQRCSVEMNEALRNDSVTEEQIEQLHKKHQQTESQLKYYRSLLKENSENNVPEVVVKKAALSISRKDIPKFQLNSDIPLLFPREEVFESADHFLSTYEKILKSGDMKLEEHWLLTFPLCLHHNYESWWLDDVVPVATCWSDVKTMFLKQFANRANFGRNIEDLWTMKMNDQETIAQYTTRFLKAVHETKIFEAKSHAVASYFVSSLVEPVKNCFNMSWFTNHSEEEEYTVQQVAGLVSNILGGDFALENNRRTIVSRAAGNQFFESRNGRRNHGNSMRGGDNSNGNMRGGRGGRGNHGGSSNSSNASNNNSPNNQYFCKMHGDNKTHNTNNCFSSGSSKRPLNNNFHGADNVPRTVKKCDFGCGEDYVPGHRCNNYYQSDTYRNRQQRINNNNRVVLSVVRNTRGNIRGSSSSSAAIDNDGDVEMGVVVGPSVSSGPRASVSAASTTMDDIATAAWKQAAEDDAFNCKYPKDDFVTKFAHITNNHFNFLTPLYIESFKLLGKIDTGSEVTLINKRTFERMQLKKLNKIDGSLSFLGSGSRVKRYGITDPLRVTYINNITFNFKFEVLEFDDNLKFDVLLGTDIFQHLNLGISGVAIKYDEKNEEKENAQFININFDMNQHEPDNSPYGSKEDQQRFMTEIQPSINKNQDIPITSFCTIPESVVELNTKEGATAYHRQYPLPHSLRPVLDKQIQDWLEAGTIKKCSVNTSFNSPLLLVPKKNALGETVDHRVCMDVRGLNKLLPDVNFPVPIIREIFEELSGKKVFTTLDLRSAYNRFLVREEDQHKLTFTHNNQQYCFQGTCFGLKHVTSVFCKVMAILFQDMECVQTYVDDCLIMSDDFETHIQDVKKVIDRLTYVNLILNPKKCHWAQHSVHMLGFVINEKGTTVDPRKLTTVENWPTPKSSKDIQSFMGLINYFRDYIPMISKVSAPIDRMRNDSNVLLHWGAQQDQSFQALKKILQPRALLHFPKFNDKFYVATDASLFGIAGVLFQKDDLGRTKHVSFISSSLSPSQRNWSTTKRELYALIFSLKKFRRFLWGRKFTAYTDHKALVYIHTQKMANPMMVGWYETLMEFDFDVIHIKGISNTLPDALSRLYPPIDMKLEGDESRIVPTKGREQAWRKRMNNGDSMNVLAVRLSKTKNETLDYMTPPESDRDSILKEAHEFGHFGSEAIVKEIHSNGLHWNNLYKNALEVVKSCPECQRHNISKKGYHPLRSISAFLPFDHIGFDLAGPLPVTNEKQSVYLMVIVDICTKYVILRALPNKQSDTVAKCLIEVFGDYGFPRIMQSDNGREFKNSLMSEIAKHLGIDRRYSCPYHSQGNGASESEVKTAMSTLRKMVKTNMRDWDNYLPMVQLSINYKMRNRTNSSAFSLMYARKLNPIKDYNNNPNEKCSMESISLEELNERVDRMTTIVFPAIHERTRKLLELEAENYNGKRRIVDIEGGSPVMIKLPYRPHKLAPIYDGPFIAVRKTQGGTYVLKDENNALLHREYTPLELKEVNIDETAIEDQVYEVEEIRDHRGNMNEREYLVKWAGYGERANSWESPSSFTDPMTIDKYWKKIQDLKQKEDKRKADLVEKPQNNSRDTQKRFKRSERTRN